MHDIRDGALSQATSSSGRLLLYVSLSSSEGVKKVFFAKFTLFKAYWLLDTIFRQSVYNRDNLTQGYAPLSFDIIQKMLGTRHAKTIVEGLKRAGCIERRESYYAGRKCKGYRLTEHAKQNIMRIEVKYPVLARKIAAKKDADKRAYPFLAENFERLSFRPEVASELARFSDNPAMQMLYEDVAEKRYYLKRDEKTGRLFTPLVNLPSRHCHLRQHLLFDGQAAVEVDVACAQPSLFICFYPMDSAERLRFIEAIWNDALYLTAMRELGMSRDDAKIEFLKQCAYGPIWADYPLFKLFCRDWPELGGIISQKRYKLGASRFACEMQKREADIVIKKVLPECASEKLTVLPIHDALLCKAADANRATEIMLRHWTAALGFVPRMKCKGWLPQHNQAA